jgi:ferritin-like protein
MNAKRMLRLCSSTKRQLDALELLLSQFAPEHKAAQFIYKSMNDVRELQHTARYETAANVTTEQAAHIQRIISRIVQLVRLLPNDIKKEYEEGD